MNYGTKSNYDICKSCEYFRKMMKTCKICNCFMPLKTKLKNAKCPKGKWGTVQNVWG